MKEDMETIRDIIKKLLHEKPKTREDDQLIHYLVLEELGFAHRVKNGIFIPWKHIVEHPVYESITRERRWQQQKEREDELNPKKWKIQSTKIMQGLREKEEMVMRNIHNWQPNSITTQSMLIPLGED